MRGRLCIYPTTDMMAPLRTLKALPGLLFAAAMLTLMIADASAQISIGTDERTAVANLRKISRTVDSLYDDMAQKQFWGRGVKQFGMSGKLRIDIGFDGKVSSATWYSKVRPVMRSEANRVVSEMSKSLGYEPEAMHDDISYRWLWNGKTETHIAWANHDQITVTGMKTSDFDNTSSIPRAPKAASLDGVPGGSMRTVSPDFWEQFEKDEPTVSNLRVIAFMQDCGRVLVEDREHSTWAVISTFGADPLARDEWLQRNGPLIEGGNVFFHTGSREERTYLVELVTRNEINARREYIDLCR
jgi:hypothetical protein